MSTGSYDTGRHASRGPIDWTPGQVRDADRALLIMYLQSWGYQCYDHETLDDLRRAAQHNMQTEGPGLGPNA